MARRNVRRSPFRTLTIRDPGSAGLDLDADPEGLPSEAMTRSENARIGPLARRLGARKVREIDVGDTNRSATRFDDNSYIEVPNAPQLSLPAGGFWRRYSLVVPPQAGVILCSTDGTQPYGPHRIEVNATPNLVSEWRDEVGTQHQNVVSTALTPGDVVHGLDVFDAAAGTFTTYVNGVVGASKSGIPSTAFPFVTDRPWHVGSDVDGAGAVIPTTHFLTALEAITVGTLRGTDLTAKGPNGLSLLDTLVKWSLQEWPNPQSSMVVLHLPLRAAGGVKEVGRDASRHRNDGTPINSVQPEVSVVAPAACGHTVGMVQEYDGTRVALYGQDGALWYEVVREGAE